MRGAALPHQGTVNDSNNVTATGGTVDRYTLQRKGVAEMR
jgi:hypothetical protein